MVEPDLNPIVWSCWFSLFNVAWSNTFITWYTCVHTSIWADLICIMMLQVQCLRQLIIVLSVYRCNHYNIMNISWGYRRISLKPVKDGQVCTIYIMYMRNSKLPYDGSWLCSSGIVTCHPFPCVRDGKDLSVRQTYQYADHDDHFERAPFSVHFDSPHTGRDRPWSYIRLMPKVT